MKAEIGCKDFPRFGAILFLFLVLFLLSREKTIFAWLSCPNECHHKKIEAPFHYFL